MPPRERDGMAFSSLAVQLSIKTASSPKRVCTPPLTGEGKGRSISSHGILLNEISPLGFFWCSAKVLVLSTAGKNLSLSFLLTFFPPRSKGRKKRHESCRTFLATASIPLPAASVSGSSGIITPAVAARSADPFPPGSKVKPQVKTGGFFRTHGMPAK